MSAPIEVRHAWLQKHATPGAQDGRFHWFPESDEVDAALRRWVVEQTQGLTAPAAWWELSEGQLVWAALFSATAEERPYRGITLSVARGAAPAHELWRALNPPPPGPYQSEVAAPAPSSPGRQRALARALLRGGTIDAPAPSALDIPALFSALEQLLGDSVPCQRRGALRAGEPGAQADELAEFLVAVHEAPADPGLRLAWRVLRELARAHACSLDRVLSTHSDEPATRWLDRLHTWGRGHDAAELARAPELAATLARRALTELLAGRGAGATLAAARWQALLPAAPRAALWSALAACAPSLACLSLRRELARSAPPLRKGASP